MRRIGRDGKKPTGWTGGSYGVGSRIKLPYTRAMITAALKGELDQVELRCDPNFCVDVPVEVPGVPKEVLNPQNTWSDPEAYDKKVRELTASFHENFSQFAGQVPPQIAFSGPDLRCQ
ncbi:MAG: phosphoenolpyruvate carboxykinase (ATP) [Anaerolineales bacterium]